MTKIDFTTPEFLLCETPVKTGGYHDQRTWIYATQALSLIEFVRVDALSDMGFTDFTYFNYTNYTGEIESYVGVFTQNNCEVTDNNENNIMDRAWRIFCEYLTQIDELNRDI